jgi:hypothetical protein
LNGGTSLPTKEENGYTSFYPGEVWLDTNGMPIQAHGGGILFHDGVYYWYGENKDTETEQVPFERNGKSMIRYRTPVQGVSCYSSTDLYNWRNEGVVLQPAPADPEHDLHPDGVVERPKVVYNDRTGKYVMWMHIDKADYQYARAGVAVSDSPTGPFTYLRSVRPNDGECRDMTLYKDEDGKAYLYFSSEKNQTMYVSLLSDDYLQPSGQFERVLVGRKREAPAPFKHRGRYYMITSGLTGWEPNEALYAVADSPMGPWELKGNPCVGPDAELTFHGQSTFVLPLAGKQDTYLFMADRWIRENLRDSRYLWLPLEFDGNEPVIRWMNQWEWE